LRNEKNPKKGFCFNMFYCYFAGAFNFSMRQKGTAQTAHGKIRGTKHKKLKVTKVN